MEWEVRIIEWLQSHIGSIGVFLGEFFAFIGGEYGLLILVIATMFCYKKELGKKLGLLVVAINAWLPMVKSVVLRPRPYISYPDRIKPIVLTTKGASAKDVAAQGFSFPSMHSASAVASYFTIANDVKKRWFWIFAIIFAFLISIFRIVVGMHYPTDVLGGWCMGLLAMGIFYLLDKHIHKNWVKHCVLLVSVLPGLFYVRTQDYFTALGLMIGFILAIPFEEKYIHYQDTKNNYARILRVLGAFLIYFGLNSLMKLPFSKEFLDSKDFMAFMVRTIRYAIIMFIITGVYPKVFPHFEKIGNKK